MLATILQSIDAKNKLDTQKKGFQVPHWYSFAVFAMDVPDEFHLQLVKMQNNLV